MLLVHWAKEVTGVQWRYDLGNSPAAVGRTTGIIFLNPYTWPTLTKDEQYFIICHEWAHIKGQLMDETKTDALAFKKYVKSGRSLKASIYALAKILDNENPRIASQLYRARKYDGLV